MEKFKAIDVSSEGAASESGLNPGFIGRKTARPDLKRQVGAEKNTFRLTEVWTLVKSVTSFQGAG